MRAMQQLYNSVYTDIILVHGLIQVNQVAWLVGWWVGWWVGWLIRYGHALPNASSSYMQWWWVHVELDLKT